MTISAHQPQAGATDADAPQRTIVLAAIRGARQRIRMVLFMRASSIACAAGVGLGAAVVLIVKDAPVWLPLVFGLTGLAGATGWAFTRTPSLTETATALDARLDLRDRTAAAFHLHRDASSVARLVVHDAAARLAAFSPTATFPLEIPRAALILVPLAIVLAASLAWDGPSRDRADAGSHPTATGSSGAAASAPNSGASSGGPRTTGDQSQESARQSAAPTPAESQRPDSRPRDGGRPRSTRSDNAPPGGQTAASGSEPAPASSAARQSNDPPARAAGQPPSQAGATGQRPGESASPASRGLGGLTPGIAAANTGGRSGRGAADGDASASARTLRGAGGVSQGTLAPGSPGVEAAAAPDGLGGRYRLARASAEAALARDAVPPDLRDYVREYFRAIAPAGQR